jgi:formamidopyrimidine-DNA glycosylase
MHFGMTGGLHVPRRAPLRLISTRGVPSSGWPPRFVKLRLVFDDGGELALADGRRLGRVRLRQDPRAEPPLSRLGFDALHELPSAARFHELLRERTAPMKALLLDQTFAAGVGNWIADEVLYQAGLDPRRPARTLTRLESSRLRVRLRSVLRTAVRVGADSDRYPRGWLFHRRWDHDPLARTSSGAPIRWETIAGRTTAWAPALQH